MKVQDAAELVTAEFAEVTERLAKQGIPVPLIMGSIIGFGVRMFREMVAQDHEAVLAFVKQIMEAGDKR